ncbi:hypothetical protein AWM79_00160 [Pseudomonas agarici]|uniref:Ricin B lectin domain-containing protein n=1 Tax=Pseudomonas agarici TaxID=46677 RepID=A0A109RB72_PSEAA|nr:RICIN domain-containing protein [Pseudomonas agarici]AMB83805.1 hypothetical protein AWM79_00160 [Pseudomonas agarici]
MEDETTPRDTEIPEQALGAPGGAERIDNGLYKIYTDLTSSMLVDMALSADGNRAHNVKLYRDNPAPESTWEFHFDHIKQGYLIINGKNQSRVLEPSGDNVVAAPMTLDTRQFWTLKKAGTQLFYIENKSNGKVLDVNGSNTAENTNIIAYTYGGTKNQKFKLVKA